MQLTKLKKNKLISIIMPVHNGGQFLDYSVKSILNQSYKSFELLIIDDNSTDNTLEIIKKYQFDKRVRVYSFKKKVGIVKCLNHGLQKSMGFYVARMDADDYSFSERFKKQVFFLKENPKISLVGSQARYFGKINFFSKLVFSDYNDCKSLIIFRNPLIHPSIMIKKNELKKLGGYKNSHKSEDYLLWSIFLEKYNGANIKENLIKYRIHDFQNGKDNLEKKKSILKIQKKWIKKLINTNRNLIFKKHYELSILNENFPKIKNFNKINSYYQWLLILKKNNEKKKIFKISSFNKILNLYSICLCISFSDHGLIAYKKYKSIKLYSNSLFIDIILISVCALKIKNFYLKKVLWYGTQVLLIK